MAVQPWPGLLEDHFVTCIATVFVDACLNQGSLLGGEPDETGRHETPSLTSRATHGVELEVVTSLAMFRLADIFSEGRTQDSKRESNALGFESRKDGMPS